MSEHITHTAICQDGHRLARALPDFPPEFVKAWDENEVPAQMGGVTRKADQFSVDVIARHRDNLQKPESDRDPQSDAKLAFILGALTHRSVDRHMKPVFQYFKQQPDYPGYNECTIYCDVLMLRECYGDDKNFPGDAFDRDKSPATPKLRRLLEHVLRRTLVSLHTFKPDVENLDEWLGKLFDATQEFKIQVDKYVEAASEPDEGKWQRYLIETNFYDTNAEIIKLARRARAGEKFTGEEVIAAIEATGEDDGRYAQALANALNYERAAAAFWRGEIGADECRTRLDIGVPELAKVYEPKRG